MNSEQQKNKEIKILLAIKNYIKANNLKELSEITNISTSSLQRYLHDDSKKYLSKDEYNKVINWLQKAKLEGLKNGGRKSQEMFGYGKDDKGHFNGRK